MLILPGVLPEHVQNIFRIVVWQRLYQVCTSVHVRFGNRHLFEGGEREEPDQDKFFAKKGILFFQEHLVRVTSVEPASKKRNFGADFQLSLTVTTSSMVQCWILTNVALVNSLLAAELQAICLLSSASIFGPNIGISHEWLSG
ncbi:hypothetical protein R1flu_024169 [Riccia fluitans]|uniref:Uncharacterized protein n=1 Tax=Riccia fluitans TaxID=41844 RepID=A0ABD1XUA6_9MARC